MNSPSIFKIVIKYVKDDQVYEAENRAFQDEEKLTEIQVKKFFYHIIGDNWFKNKYGTGYKLYIIGDYYDYSFAVYKQIYILEREHFTLSSICHELAHACKHTRGSVHGRAWQKRYVELIERYVSFNKAEELSEEFSKLT